MHSIAGEANIGHKGDAWHLPEGWQFMRYLPAPLSQQGRMLWRI